MCIVVIVPTGIFRDKRFEFADYLVVILPLGDSSTEAPELALGMSYTIGDPPEIQTLYDNFIVLIED